MSLFRVRLILRWHPIPNTVGRCCTNTDTGNYVSNSLGIHMIHTLHILYVCLQMYGMHMQRAVGDILRSTAHKKHNHVHYFFLNRHNATTASPEWLTI